MSFFKKLEIVSPKKSECVKENPTVLDFEFNALYLNKLLEYAGVSGAY